MIRKFKHKQSGVIVTNIGLLKGFYRAVGAEIFDTLDARFIENTTDWVEIQEPKYQILSFQHPESGNVYKLQPDGTYGYPGKAVYMQYVDRGLHIPYEQCIKRYPIHSVKRLSDGVVFKLGSWFSQQGSKPFKIIAFKLIGESCFVQVSNYRFTCMSTITFVAEPPVTATVTVTYSDKRPKTVQQLSKGEALLIHF